MSFGFRLKIRHARISCRLLNACNKAYIQHLLLVNMQSKDIAGLKNNSFGVLVLFYVLLFSLLCYKCTCVFQTAWQLSYILFHHCRFHWCWKQALQWSAMIPFTCALKTGSNALKSACHLTRSIPKYFLQACVASSVPAKLCAARLLSLSVCSGVYF